MYQRIVPRCVSVKALSRAFPALTPTGAEEIRRVMREGYKVPFGEHPSFGVARMLIRDARARWAALPETEKTRYIRRLEDERAQALEHQK